MRHSVGLAFMRLWAATLSLLLVGQVGAQDIAVGTWRTHFSYQNARILVQTEDKLFCAVENGLFSYDRTDQSIRKLSKLDGLSGAGISAMAYDEADKVLIIGYRSGLIDLVFEDRVETIRDLANSALDGDKTVNDITIADGTAYLGTGLGIIVIELQDAQIAENYIQIGMGGSEANVFEVIATEGKLFALTNEGVQSGSLDQNLLDFNNWTMYENTESFQYLTLVGSELFALNNTELFQLQNDTWIDAGIDLPANASKLFESQGQLLTVADGVVFRLDNASFVSEAVSSLDEINDLAFFDGQYFFADAQNGLQSVTGEVLSPVGPTSDAFSNLKALGREVYGFHAPIFTYDGSQEVASYSQFVDGAWQQVAIEGFPNVSDVTNFNGSRYFTSFGFGLFEEETGQIIRDIPDSASGADTLLTSVDSGNQLWVVSEASEPIHSLSSQGEWSSFTASSVFGSSFRKVDVAESGIAWALKFDGQIAVIDLAENQTDLLSSSDGMPPSVLDVHISVEDNAWVASPSGPALFPSASFVFFDDEAIRPTFDNRTLFEDQRINAIVTDGGNRVWFGTEQGLWVFGENTSEQVALFNEENSPLPSNNVLDLAYNGSNGEVFVATDRGLVSYRSNSSNGSRNHRGVSVFPNPVRPDYTGQVGISGLARNASVKVTDINGNLVKELAANGATASWDLRDQNGSNVSTGVYFFFSATADGEETFVGKLAVIR